MVSSTPVYYPQVDKDFLVTVELLMQACQSDEGLSNCPYPHDIKESVKQVFGTLISAKRMVAGAQVPEDFSETEIISMIQNLKGLQDDGKLETNEKIQILKANAALLERLIGMREKVTNIKKLNEFQGVVLTFLNENLSVEQQQALAKKLEEGALI